MSNLTAGTDYAKEWKSVQQLIEKGNMESAQTKANNLFDAARKERNSYRTLYGALMLQQIEYQYQEDTFNKALARYQAIEPELKTEDHALLMLFESKMYERYLNMNRWNIRKNIHPEVPTNDIAVWDEQLFSDTIHALQAKALAVSDVLKKTKSSNYADLLTESNASGRALRPTLYDVVMQDIFNNDVSDNEDEQVQAIFDDSALYGPADGFCTLLLPEGDSIPFLRNLRILQELARFHADDDSAIRCALDEQRLQFVENSVLRDKILFREGLEQLTETYKRKNETAERGHWYYRQAFYWHQLSQEDEEYTPQHNITAYNLCSKGIVVAPKASEAYASCSNLMAELTHPTLSVNVPGVLLPDEECKAIVSHDNLTHVWFRIIKSNDDDGYFDKDAMRELLKRPVLNRWDMAVEDPHRRRSWRRALSKSSMTSRTAR